MNELVFHFKGKTLMSFFLKKEAKFYVLQSYNLLLYIRF